MIYEFMWRMGEGGWIGEVSGLGTGKTSLLRPLPHLPSPSSSHSVWGAPGGWVGA